MRADGPPRPLAERKRLGAWYTPDQLAMRIVTRAAGYVSGPLRHVLDPCAGDGAFLLAARELQGSRAEAAAPGEIRLYGVDADPLAVAACRQRVAGARVALGDSLLSEAEGGVSWSELAPDALAQGGFDLAVGNPPWEVLEASAHAPRSDRRAYAAAIRRSAYPLLEAGAGGGGKVNLFRVATARAFSLLRSGGVLAFLVPGGLLRDAGSQALRASLLEAGDWLEVWELETGAGLFPSAHRDLACCAIFVRKGGPTEAIVVVPTQLAPAADSPAGDRAGSRDVDPVVLTRSVLVALGAPDGVIPLLSNDAERDLMARLWRLPALSACVAAIRKGDVNLATDRAMFTDRPTPLALRTGKEIAPYRIRREPDRWVAPRQLPANGPWQSVRVAWRDIADRTLRKRMCAALVPASSVLGDTLNYLELKGDLVEAQYYLAVLNSHVFEWAVRRRSAHNHLGGRTVGPCPVPPYREDLRCRELADLACRAGQDPEAAARADAIAAQLYGLETPDLDTVLAGFPKQPAAIRSAIQRAFQSRI